MLLLLLLLRLWNSLARILWDMHTSTPRTVHEVFEITNRRELSDLLYRNTKYVTVVFEK